jgi:hypothetical protein
VHGEGRRRVLRNDERVHARQLRELRTPNSVVSTTTATMTTMATMSAPLSSPAAHAHTQHAYHVTKKPRSHAHQHSGSDAQPGTEGDNDRECDKRCQVQALHHLHSAYHKLHDCSFKTAARPSLQSR